jgi:hypothetical protein
MGDRAPQQTQISQRVEGVRVVQHIQERGALAPWMAGQVVQLPRGHNTLHCHLRPNMD